MGQEEARQRMLRALDRLARLDPGGGPASPDPRGTPPGTSLGDPTEAARADLFAEMVDRQRQATSDSIDRLLGGVLRPYRGK